MAVYLICLDEELVAFSGRRWKRSRHYLGRTQKRGTEASVAKRLEEHRKGYASGGAKYLDEANLRGISYDVVRIWNGDDPMRRDGETDALLERRLKNRGHHARLCPRCREKHVAIVNAYRRAKRNGTYVKPERPPDLDALAVLEEAERAMERDYEEIPF